MPRCVWWSNGSTSGPLRLGEMIGLSWSPYHPVFARTNATDPAYEPPNRLGSRKRGGGRWLPAEARWLSRSIRRAHAFLSVPDTFYDRRRNTTAALTWGV